MANRNSSVTASSFLKKGGGKGDQAGKKLEEAERRAAKAEQRAEQAEKSMALLIDQVAALTAEVKKLTGQRAEIDDSNQQMKDLFGAAAVEKDPIRKQALSMKLLDVLPALNVKTALHSVVAPTKTEDSSMEIATTENETADSAALTYVDAQVSNSTTIVPLPTCSYATAAAKAPGTPAKRHAPKPLDSSSVEASEESGGEMEEVLNKKKEKRNKSKIRRLDNPGMPAPLAAPQPTNKGGAASDAARPARTPPLLLQGMTEDQKKANYIYLHRLFNVDNSLIARTNITKAGNIVITPANAEASAALLSATLPDNLSVKVIDKNRQRPTAPFIVLRGVPLELDNDALTAAIGLPCHRLLSALNKGKPTTLVKVNVVAEEQKKEILANGIRIGRQHVRAIPYKDESSALLCYNCNGVGHIAKSCKKEKQCRRCGGLHLAANCTAAEAKCSNCGEEHEATNPACPAIIKHREEKKAKVLTTAAKARQPADNVEALRLAACVAACFKSFASKANLDIQQADIANFVARSVREAYKVNLTGPHVKSLLLANEAPTEAQI